MKWFRTDKVGNKHAEDMYGATIRSAVDRFREQDFARAVRGFRDAAQLRPLDKHHEALMKRAISRWKQSGDGDVPGEQEPVHRKA